MASDSVARALALSALSYKESHDKGNYTEIKNKPLLNGKVILGSHTGDYYDLPLLDETANKIALLMDSESYILRAQLKNKAGDIIDSAVIDLPLEEMIIEGKYEEDSEGEGWLVLTLHNGNEIRIPLSGLIDELATIEYVDFQDDYLESLIDSEKQIRRTADSELGERIDLLRADLDSEAVIRQAKDDELTLLLSSETSERMAQDEVLLQLINSESGERAAEDARLLALLNSETSERMAKDAELKAFIDSEALIRQAKDDELTLLITSETSERMAEDANLLSLITSETSERMAKDAELLVLINSEADARVLGDSELEALVYSRTSEDDLTIKRDVQNRLFVPIDFETIRINSEGRLYAQGSSAIQSYLNGVLLDSEATTESAKIVAYLSNSEYEALDSEAKLDETIYIVYDAEPDPLVQTTSYNRLVDKPSIAGQTLSGDKSLASFGIQPVVSASMPLAIAANNLSLVYDSEDFYMKGTGGDTRFAIKTAQTPVSYVNYANGFQGAAWNCKKFIGGLYVGYCEIQTQSALQAGEEYELTTRFGADDYDFASFVTYGLDKSTGAPITIRCNNGVVTAVPSASMPILRRICFSFVAYL